MILFQILEQRSKMFAKLKAKQQEDLRMVPEPPLDFSRRQFLTAGGLTAVTACLLRVI
jgi:hypothetical protein